MSADEQHEHIKWLLRTQGSSLADVARALDVQPSAVTLVSKGRGRSRRIENAIAKATGLRPAQLWPKNYPDQKEAEMTT
ncbi:MAG: hypothetical protein CL955_00100 [Erythrobacteraceae bacterium]|nr:hypothetical protein [Erythrobacteraceae bacterium]